ncbi:MAG: FAM49 family protein [Piptocephalis tieghemiana]|nr:MAG: FAM49 family protein [Piptocephalis tieghemiana]
MGALFVKAGEPVPDLRVDLENAQPTQEELETYNRVLDLLQPTTHILASLREYQGCGEFIRQAISTPSQATEETAWDAVCPAADKLRECYEYSAALETAVPLLLSSLCGHGDVNSALERQPALARLFADILDFVFEFDELKMGNPAIQNDFSYYRRSLNRLKLSRQVMKHPVINDELANRMSLFYADHAPMMKAVTEVTSSFCARAQDHSSSTPSSASGAGGGVPECLAGLIGVCYHAVSKRRVRQPEAIAFCLRVMVACTILYDHVHPAGVFVKGSPINVKNIVRIVQEDGDRQSATLLNALRYSTRHLNHESTPKNIRALLTA